MTHPAGFTWYHADQIQASIDGVDHVAKQMEAKWGVGRLELLVDDELRARFRRQQEKLDAAIDMHQVDQVKKHADAMRKAWQVLDTAATQAGALELDPQVWEIGMPDGRVVAFTRSNVEAFSVTRNGRYVEVWTVEEIARVIENFPSVASAKQIFPGTLVSAIRVKRPSLDLAAVDRGDKVPF